MDGEQDGLVEREAVDLTQEQINSGDNQDEGDLDEFDLLDATVDPNDIETKAKVNIINEQLVYEEHLIRAKIAFRSAMQDDNPFILHE